MNPRQWGLGDQRRLATRDFPPAVLALVDARQGGRHCVQCRELGIQTPESEPLQIDHKQPHSQGGDNHHLNLRWACRAHNCARGAKPVSAPPRLPTWARQRDQAPQGQVVILRGIPGAGKSTYAQEHLRGALVISSDRHFVRADGTYRFERARLGQVHEACLSEYRAALAAGRTLIAIDKCNLSWRALAPYVEAACSAGYCLRVVTLLADPLLCWRRNVHAVPKAKVLELSRLLGRDRLPSWLNVETIRTDLDQQGPQVKTIPSRTGLCARTSEVACLRPASDPAQAVTRAYVPWERQRQFHSSTACIRCIVAGRQSGKTHCAAEEVVQLVLARPGTESCLLVPTYKSSKAALRHLKRAVRPLGRRVRWKEVDKCFVFFNGACLYVRTGEDKEGVPTRGLTLDGVLWVDEAAYVSRAAWEAARLTQVAVADPKVVLTGTPCGRNWLYEEFQAGRPGAAQNALNESFRFRSVDSPGAAQNALNESFRFRSVDSPYCNVAFVEDLRRKLGAKKALQELYAQFLGDAGAAFNHEDIAALFAGELAIRGQQCSLGVDLAKEQDFTVCTLLNEFGEAWVLGRWQHVAWPDTERRITDLANQHGALVVVDLGHGGGYGGAMHDYLVRSLGEGRVQGVRTGNLGVKAQLCEALVADVENRRLRIEEGEYAQHLRHELTFFESHREVVGGVERIRYHGPQGGGEDDHDDCVISLALANWGRLHGWEGPQDETEDLIEYVEAARKLQTRIDRDDDNWPRLGSGYFFPSGSGYVF